MQRFWNAFNLALLSLAAFLGTRSDLVSAQAPDRPVGVQPNAEEKGASGERRWYIYEDADSPTNHGHFTNYMPAAEMIDLKLADKTDPRFGQDCISAKVTFRRPFWCGVAAACQPDYWGEQPSDTAFHLSGAKKLVFYARGERGNECIQVKVAIAGDKQFGDSARIAPATSWLKLSTKWQRYELPVDRADLSRVVTPFCFVTSLAQNNVENGEIQFYLDHIYFVMESGR